MKFKIPWLVEFRNSKEFLQNQNSNKVGSGVNRNDIFAGPADRRVVRKLYGGLESLESI